MCDHYRIVQTAWRGKEGSSFAHSLENCSLRPATVSWRSELCILLLLMIICVSRYSQAVGLAVKRCLNQWVNISAQVIDSQCNVVLLIITSIQAHTQEQLGSMECFIALCVEIGPTIDASSK